MSLQSQVAFDDADYGGDDSDEDDLHLREGRQ